MNVRHPAVQEPCRPLQDYTRLQDTLQVRRVAWPGEQHPLGLINQFKSNFISCNWLHSLGVELNDYCSAWHGYGWKPWPVHTYIYSTHNAIINHEKLARSSWTRVSLWMEMKNQKTNTIDILIWISSGRLNEKRKRHLFYYPFNILINGMPKLFASYSTQTALFADVLCF